MKTTILVSTGRSAGPAAGRSGNRDFLRARLSLRRFRHCSAGTTPRFQSRGSGPAEDASRRPHHKTAGHFPYGSAFPEDAWGEINQFLQRGGNLLVLGGRPFARAAYRDASGWHLRDYSVRFTRPLMIDQYQPTPGSDGLEFQNNSEIPLQLPRFSWKRGFSPVIRLSAVDLYKRGGSAGAIDARLDTLAWGVKDGRKLAAPAIEIDHLRNGFNGGRWIFVNAELTTESLGNRALPVRSLRGPCKARKSSWYGRLSRYICRGSLCSSMSLGSPGELPQLRQL